MGHLKDVKKNYFTHLFGAWKAAILFLFGAFRCFVHGLIPNVDTECAQNTAKKALGDIESR